MANRSRERQQMYFDAFITAIEGGVQYWANVNDYWYDKDNLVAGATVTDREDFAETYEVTVETISVGLNRILNKKANLSDASVTHFRRNFKSLDDWDLDALDCDEILQTGIFGEPIYG